MYFVIYYLMKSENFIYDNKIYSITIGGNKYENTNLVLNSQPNDVWFHICGAPSTHIFLKNDCKLNDIPRQVIKRCAYLCKINTNSAKSKPKCDVIYTTIDNVETTDIPGTVITQNTKMVSV
jgi:predicted ribosome quality control (RQC) complex YloA/Tae2 family protein